MALLASAVLIFSKWSATEATMTMAWFNSLSTAAAIPTNATSVVDLEWYPPRNTSINNLTVVGDWANTSGVYGFIFNSSFTPDDVYGTYNWCNMPHVRKKEYVRPSEEYELKYIEVIQRHHKRTPYASNSFPVEEYHWDCNDEGLFFYGAPFKNGPYNDNDQQEQQHKPAQTFWQGIISPTNPFGRSGWQGTCQFPQLTSAGLADSYVHGEDIYGVYHDLLSFLPARDDDPSTTTTAAASNNWRSKVIYRVTQNVITSQVAGMLISGTWHTTDRIPLLIEAAGADSLEPQYPCPGGTNLFNAIQSPSSNPAWGAHLTAAESLYSVLDYISGVPGNDSGFHASFDHYFDNLSARQCHGKALPCSTSTNRNDNGTEAEVERACINQTLANAVYRFGEWEYSQVYRDAPMSLEASVASYGIWIAELAVHLRAVLASDGDESSMPLYFHNIAHDGSVSLVLSILQIDVMVWPGMGSEVVFELWKRAGEDVAVGLSEGESGNESESDYYIRVLFGGQVLTSSNPSLGVMDMLPVETLLAYFDGLVGQNASSVVDKCTS
ncbi:histidine acid phosphatase [Xylariaceae sp. FL0255]|nr:histidine acid phosphatase [Xylariaceae sp. FL0255]